MKRYVAYIGKNNRILSVLAANDDDARGRVREQLDRPGRRGILRRWQGDGEKVREDK